MFVKIARARKRERIEKLMKLVIGSRWSLSLRDDAMLMTIKLFMNFRVKHERAVKIYTNFHSCSSTRRNMFARPWGIMRIFILFFRRDDALKYSELISLNQFEYEKIGGLDQIGFPPSQASSIVCAHTKSTNFRYEYTRERWYGSLLCTENWIELYKLCGLLAVINYIFIFYWWRNDFSHVVATRHTSHTSHCVWFMEKCSTTEKIVSHKEAEREEPESSQDHWDLRKKQQESIN